MSQWEEAFAQAVSVCQGVKEEALEIASDALHYDAVHRAHVHMEGLLVAVRKTLAHWVCVLEHPQEAVVGAAEEGEHERLLCVLEPYMAFLFERKGALFAIYQYLVFDYPETALEHVWQVAAAAWRQVAAEDKGLRFYTKRGVLVYAYGRVLHWWCAHQDADFCLLMDTLRSFTQQGMRAGHFVSTGIADIMEKARDSQGSKGV